MSGGLLTAGTIAAGFALPVRRPAAPVLIRPRHGDAPLAETLETAA
ncbi:hypothetical protein OHB00_03285 [Streptomyces sp. NBC_00631]